MGHQNMRDTLIFFESVHDGLTVDVINRAGVHQRKVRCADKKAIGPRASERRGVVAGDPFDVLCHLNGLAVGH